MTAVTHLLPAPLEQQPHGGALRRGNPGNKGPGKSALARSILEAKTPQAARQLAHIALKGELPDGRKGQRVQVSVQDRIKAIGELLARGGVVARTEVTGADGAPFTLLVRAATDGD